MRRRWGSSGCRSRAGCLPEPVAVAPTHDVVFVGKLSYEPNVEAIERLARMWPIIERRRPSTTMLLAGARPTPQVLEVAERLGWTVEIDFPDLGELMGRVRVAAVPLVHASGIQTKVLDAAMYGVAQVMSPVAAEGLGPDFPTVVADGDERFVDAIVELLDDPPRLLDLGRRSRDHFAETYTPGRWVGWAERTLTTADSARRRRGD